MPCGVLVCEELTQLEVQLWADIAKVQMAGVAFILCGGFLQFPAIAEHWAGCAAPGCALDNSNMVRDLSGNSRLILTENKRRDQILYGHTSLPRRPLAEVLQEARNLFPLTSREAETTLVISHARRRFLNCQRNLWDRPPDFVFIRAPVTGKTGNGPQSMWV